MRTAHSLPHDRSDSYDWISAEDVVRHALAAFHECRRETDGIPLDYRDQADLDTHHEHGRRTFAESVGLCFAERVYQSGAQAGLRGFYRGPSENPLPGLSGPEIPIIGDTPDIHCALSMPRWTN